MPLAARSCNQSEQFVLFLARRTSVCVITTSSRPVNHARITEDEDGSSIPRTVQVMYIPSALSGVMFLTLLSRPVLMSSPGTSHLCDPYTLRKVDIGFGFGRALSVVPAPAERGLRSKASWHTRPSDLYVCIGNPSNSSTGGAFDLLAHLPPASI